MGETIKERTAKLAATARALKLKSGGGDAGPYLAFVTDGARGVDARQVAMSLPAGTAIILRDYGRADRGEIAATLKAVARVRNLLLFVGGDAALAVKVDADGVHLRSDQLVNPPERRGLLVSTSCHNEEELERAGVIGADLALLGPAFPTASHPGAAGLGPARFKELAARSPVPVLAIGGVDETNAGALAGRNVAGFAAIGAFGPIS